MVQIAPGSDSVQITIIVPLTSPDVLYRLTIALIAPSGDTVFRGGPVAVEPFTGRSATIDSMPISYVGVGFDAASVEIVTMGARGFFGQAVTVDAVAKDGQGNPIPGTPILWSSLNPQLATVPDPGQGTVVAGMQRGSAQIVATLLTGPADTGSVMIQPPPSAVIGEGGDQQTGPVGGTLTMPLQIQVTGSDGLGVEDVSVDFTTPDGGSFTSSSVVTDATGRGQTQWVLGTVAGGQTAAASVSGAAQVQFVFNATATALAATGLDFGIQPSDAFVGAAIAPPVTVRAVDQFGNTDPSFTSDVTVGLGSNPGGAMLGGTLLAPASAGVASFADLTVDAPGAGYTLTATAPGVTAATSATFDVTVAPTSHQWVGGDAGGATDWFNPNNWDTGLVPIAVDNVLLPASAADQPVLTANASINDLVVESGATLDIGAFDLTATGDVDAGATIVGSGTVVLTGSGVTLQGTVPNLVVNGDVTLAAQTFVTANATVSGATAQLDLGADDLTVGADFAVDSDALLWMTDPSNVLVVGGHATFDGASTASPTSTLTGGVIRVAGDFTQLNTTSDEALQSQGTAVELNGAALQTVTFTGPVATTPPFTGSFFQQLDITNTAGGVLFADWGNVAGDLTSPATSRSKPTRCSRWPTRPISSSLAATPFSTARAP